MTESVHGRQAHYSTNHIILTQSEPIYKPFYFEFHGNTILFGLLMFLYLIQVTDKALGLSS